MNNEKRNTILFSVCKYFKSFPKSVESKKKQKLSGMTILVCKFLLEIQIKTFKCHFGNFEVTII